MENQQIPSLILIEIHDIIDDLSQYKIDVGDNTLSFSGNDVQNCIMNLLDSIREDGYQPVTKSHVDMLNIAYAIDHCPNKDVIINNLIYFLSSLKDRLINKLTDIGIGDVLSSENDEFNYYIVRVTGTSAYLKHF